MGTLAGLLTIVQMGSLAYIIHAAIVLERPVDQLTGWFGLLLLALALRAVSQGVQSRFMAHGSRTVRDNARRQLLAAWHKAGPLRLLDESAATLSREWLDQVEALHGYFARYLPQIQLAVLIPLAILVTVIGLDWLAALFLLVAAPLIPLFMALVGMGAESLQRRHFQTMGRLSGQFLDRVRGLTTLQLFNQTGPAADILQARSDDFRRITMKTLRVAFLSSAVLEFFASVSIAVIAMYIGFGLLGYIDFGPASELTLFSGLFILLLAPEFFQPLRQLAQHYHDRAAALGAAELIVMRLSDSEPTRPQTENTAHEEAIASPDVIALNHAGVIFSDGRVGLNDVSMTIDKGERLALTGPSGGGKSTLLHLLAGFMPATSGSVAVFGRRPGDQIIGWLGQSPYIAHGTWKDQLRLTAPHASTGEMKEALAFVGLTGTLASRPQGLDSPISEAGIGLSGGQARRLSLARLFLSPAELILMDEPTAGLDADTEKLLLASLKTFADQGRTLVFATHHESLLALAERKITLRAGRCVHE
ncbi:MAG: thiol reductant ABC exporter subunit CydD [Oleiphilaceae bacterium]|nr:thiol reductant ABC exporter subunit CydD [Oleiphilaceae bacterium]